MGSLEFSDKLATEARPLPVDDKGASASIVSITESSVALYYYDGSGVQQTDAGQVAGTVVVAHLKNDNIRNELGGLPSTNKGSVVDTSLAFTCNALTTLVDFDFTKEAWDEYGAKERANNIVTTADLSNGEYVFDAKTGYIYGKKATTTFVMTTVSYKVGQNTPSSGGVAENVNVAKIAGTVTNVNGGNRDAGTQTVTLADNDPAVTSLADIANNSKASATATGVATLFDADGDNTAQVCKASAGNLYGFSISNTNAVDTWIQFFDLATGDVTVGTTTPKVSYLIPAGDGTDDGASGGQFTIPITFATAITYVCTTTPTGAGDPTTGLVVNLNYK